MRPRGWLFFLSLGSSWVFGLFCWVSSQGHRYAIRGFYPCLQSVSAHLAGVRCCGLPQAWDRGCHGLAHHLLVL